MHPVPQHRTAIARWLTLCAALVVLMVLVGGVTRLTESGLSIVKWNLVSGTLPPMGEAAWQKEFAEYQTSPQYQQVNRSFSLGDFKQIFWLEYVHRLLGRITGLALVLPYVYFLARRQLPGWLVGRGAFLCVLVAAQGTVGWVMVASGLVDQPRVAPIKLSLHLLLAFALFAALLWTRWQVNATSRLAVSRRVSLAARALLALATLQIFAGALVAGLRAGKIYNTYPLMDGKWMPDGLTRLAPHWLNYLENIAMVQFQHRWLAVVVALLVLGFAAWAKPLPARLRKALAHTLLLQFALGVATLLSVVHIGLASAHQLGALLLFALLTRVVYLSQIK